MDMPYVPWSYINEKFLGNPECQELYEELKREYDIKKEMLSEESNNENSPDQPE